MLDFNLRLKDNKPFNMHLILAGEKIAILLKKTMLVIVEQVILDKI